MALLTAGEGILGCGRSRLEVRGEGDLDATGDLGGEDLSDGEREEADLEEAWDLGERDRGDSGDRGDSDLGDSGDLGEWCVVGDAALGGTGR